MDSGADLDRRGWIFAAAAATASFLMSGCKTRKHEASPSSPPPIAIDSSTTQPSKVYSYNALSAIQELQTTTAANRMDLTTELVFYGTLARAMMAINLPRYQVGSLNKISIYTSNGDPLAFKAIGKNDANRLNSLYPIFFENLSLKDTSPLTIVYDLSDGSPSCKEQTGAVRFHSQYKNLPVLEAIGPDFADLRPFANFGVSDPSGMHCQPNATSAYTLECDQNVSIVGASGFKGFEICDILSRPMIDANGQILQDGSQFVDVFENPFLIAYKFKDNAYYRTIIRLF